MRHASYQIALRRMMLFVALCAISLATLATPASLLALAIWIVLAGVLVDRARGGDGTVGGALTGGLAAVVLMALFATLAHDDPRQYIDPLELIFSCLLAAPPGLVFGALVSAADSELLRAKRRTSRSFQGKTES